MTAPTFDDFPSVMLSTIFTFVCEDEPVHVPFHPTDQRCILFLVCTRWNDIVRSTSALWSNILITDPRSWALRFSHNAVISQFTLCTARSRNDLLTISIENGYTDQSSTIINSIIPPNIHRIRRLTSPIIFHPRVIDALMASEGQYISLASMEVISVNPWAQANSTVVRYTFLPAPPRHQANDEEEEAPTQRQIHFVVSLRVTVYVHTTIHFPFTSM